MIKILENAKALVRTTWKFVNDLSIRNHEVKVTLHYVILYVYVIITYHTSQSQVSRWWESFHKLPRKAQRAFYDKLWDRIKSGDKSVKDSHDADGNSIGGQYYG